MEKFRKLVYVCFVIELIIITYGIFNGVYDDGAVVSTIKSWLAN